MKKFIVSIVCALFFLNASEVFAKPVACLNNQDQDIEDYDATYMLTSNMIYRIHKNKFPVNRNKKIDPVFNPISIDRKRIVSEPLDTTTIQEFDVDAEHHYIYWIASNWTIYRKKLTPAGYALQGSTEEVYKILFIRPTCLTIRYNKGKAKLHCRDFNNNMRAMKPIDPEDPYKDKDNPYVLSSG